MPAIEATQTSEINSREDLLSSPAPAVTTKDQAITCFSSRPGRLSATPRAQRDGHAGRLSVDDIMWNIDVLLSGRRHRNFSEGAPITRASEGRSLASAPQTPLRTAYARRPSLLKDSQSIDSSDITNILDIVVKGTQDACRDSLRSRYHSLLLHSGMELRPSLQTSQILPGSSAAADPATTICAPRPYFSWSGSSDAFRRLYSKPETTYISRQSVTEIDWDTALFLRDESADDVGKRLNWFMSKSHNPSRRQSSFWARPRQRSWPQPIREAPNTSLQTDGFEISPSQEVSNPFSRQFRRRLSQWSASEPLFGCSPDRQAKRLSGTVSMTSFPRLKSRSCTNDWLTPLGLANEAESSEPELRRQTVSDLYSYGVDAHIGTSVGNGQLPVVKEDSRSTPQTPASDMLSPSFCSHPTFPGSEIQWPYETGEIDEPDGRRLGRSIGSATHRRIGLKSLDDERKDLDSRCLVDQLRRYTLIPLLEGMPNHLRRTWAASSATVTSPLEGDEASKEGQGPVRGLLQDILYKADPSADELAKPKPLLGDRRKSYAAPCSEETSPHVCMDDLTPWSEQSLQLG